MKNCYLIDPEPRTITPITWPEKNIAKIRGLLGCRYFTIAYLDNGDTIYVDDEGLYNAENFFKLPSYPYPLAGKGLVMGSTDINGETLPPNFDIGAYKNSIEFLTLQDIVALYE